MSEHKCSLPRTDFSGLQKLPPNASFCMRLRRQLRRLILLDPDGHRSIAFYHHKSAIKAAQRRHATSPYKYMIHPFSTLNTILDVAFLVIWVTKMITSPMLNNMMEEIWIVHLITHSIFSIVQGVIIICIFFVGYINQEGNQVIMKPSSVVKRYLTTYFLFDLVATKILDPALEKIVTETVSDPILRWQLHFALRLVDVPCLYVRLASILEDLNNAGEAFGVPLRIRKTVRYMLRTYLYLHLFCCGLYFVPQLMYHGDWPIDSWLLQAKISPSQKPSLHRIYGECMLFTMCFFFGASPGKFRVSQPNEQICLTLISLFGRLYTLFMLADVLRFFGIVGLSEASYEKQILQLCEYMATNDIPTNLSSRMVRYYENKLRKRYFNEREILGSLSDRLKAELFLYSARKLMHKSDVFRCLPDSDIATLISMMRVETFAPGDVIFSPGQELGTVYFISFGTVEIMTRNGLELCHMEDGDVFGLSTSPDRKRNFFAVVIETTELFTIELDELEDFLEGFPRASQYLKELVVERMRIYAEAEQNIKHHTDNCLEELRKGVLLEKKRKRKLVGE